MKPKAIDVKPLNNYEIELKFDNGEVKLEKMIADFFAEEYRQARGYHK